MFHFKTPLIIILLIIITKAESEDYTEAELKSVG